MLTGAHRQIRARLRNSTGPLRQSRTVRVICVNAVVDAAGTGAYLSMAVLFFTRFGGVSAAGYGVGLAIAGCIGLAATPPVTALADRIPVKYLVIFVALWRAAGFTLLAFVHGLVQFVLVLSVLYLFDRSAGPLNQALIGALLTGADRTRAVALMRSVRNVGFSIGFITTGIVLQIGTKQVYLAVFFLNAATFVVMAVLVAALPARPAPAGQPPTAAGTGNGGDAGRPGPAPDGPGERARPPVRNARFVRITMANSVLFLYAVLLLSVLPLWVAVHTEAPLWTITVLLLTNTAIAVLGQVRVSRSLTDIRTATRAVNQSAGCLTMCCLLLALSGIRGRPYLSVALLIAAVIFLSAAEVLHSAAATQLSFDLAPAQLQAAYLGFFNTGLTAAELFGAAAILFLVSHLGAVTWLMLAAIFPIAAWANRSAVLVARAPDDDG
jgi:MFS family permease